jgi:hypothetical protein
MIQVYIKVLLLIISMWTTVGCSAKMPDGEPHDVQATDRFRRFRS